MNTIAHSVGIDCGSGRVMRYEYSLRSGLRCVGIGDAKDLNTMILRMDPFQKHWYDGFVNTLAHTAQELREATAPRHPGVW